MEAKELSSLVVTYGNSKAALLVRYAGDQTSADAIETLIEDKGDSPEYEGWDIEEIIEDILKDVNATVISIPLIEV